MSYSILKASESVRESKSQSRDVYVLATVGPFALRQVGSSAMDDAAGDLGQRLTELAQENVELRRQINRLRSEVR